MERRNGSWRRNRADLALLQGKITKKRLALHGLEHRAGVIEKELIQIEDMCKEDDQGEIPVLCEPNLWKTFQYERILGRHLDQLILTNKDDIREIEDFFAYLYTIDVFERDDRAYTWRQNIPEEAVLKLCDVLAVKTEGLKLPVISPYLCDDPNPGKRTILSINNRMFHMEGEEGFEQVLERPYGLFVAESNPQEDVSDSELETWPINPCHFNLYAVRGPTPSVKQGPDGILFNRWYKLHPSLLQHVRAWKCM